MEDNFIDRSFRPNLLKRSLTQKERASLERWGMDPVGVPVQMSQSLKVAVWRGADNSQGEAPVLAVMTRPETTAKPGFLIWYAGILTVRSTITPDEFPLLAYVDAAEYGPYVLPDALELLMKIVPPPPS